MSSWNPNIIEYISCQQHRSGDDRNSWCLNCQNNLSKHCKKVKQPINQFAYRFGQIIRSELSEPLPSNNNNRLTPVRKTSSFLDDPNLHNSNLYAPTPSLILVDFLRSYFVFKFLHV